jgi:hypothetical protein
MNAPPPSFLSNISEFVRTKLNEELFDDVSYRVTVDSPSGVQKMMDAESSPNGALNLFFYRFEPSGFFPQAAADQRWHVRARCLVTAFSISETDAMGIVPAGEIDLRVLGSVMQYFHENPVMIDGAKSWHLEVVPGNLSSEEINQIWASQHNVPYRPSLLYEFALLPVEPQKFGPLPGMVVEGGARTRVNAVEKKNYTGPRPNLEPPQSPFMEVSKSADWSPLLSFVTSAKRAVQTLEIAANSTDSVMLWIAGLGNSNVTLVWEHVVKGVWVAIDTAPITVVIPIQNANLSGIIDPDFAERLASTESLAMIDVSPPTASSSYLLFAIRDTPQGLRRSNPLMLHRRG